MNLYCKNCGKQNEDTNRFCQYCGGMLSTPDNPFATAGDLGKPKQTERHAANKPKDPFFTAPANFSPAGDLTGGTHRQSGGNSAPAGFGKMTVDNQIDTREPRQSSAPIYPSEKEREVKSTDKKSFFARNAKWLAIGGAATLLVVLLISVAVHFGNGQGNNENVLNNPKATTQESEQEHKENLSGKWCAYSGGSIMGTTMAGCQVTELTLKENYLAELEYYKTNSDDIWSYSGTWSTEKNAAGETELTLQMEGGYTGLGTDGSTEPCSTTLTVKVQGNQMEVLGTMGNFQMFWPGLVMQKNYSLDDYWLECKSSGISDVSKQLVGDWVNITGGELHDGELWYYTMTEFTLSSNNEATLEYYEDAGMGAGYYEGDWKVVSLNGDQVNLSISLYGQMTNLEINPDPDTPKEKLEMQMTIELSGDKMTVKSVSQNPSCVYSGMAFEKDLTTEEYAAQNWDNLPSYNLEQDSMPYWDITGTWDGYNTNYGTGWYELKITIYSADENYVDAYWEYTSTDWNGSRKTVSGDGSDIYVSECSDEVFKISVRFGTAIVGSSNYVYFYPDGTAIVNFPFVGDGNMTHSW